jgi:hypothetical protein
MLILRFIPIALLALTCDADAGPPEAATEQVRAQLIASVDAVRPGDTFQAGVHQEIIPHWHTYWINPGDSGLATRIDYDLPPGATPTNTIFDPAGKIGNLYAATNTPQFCIINPEGVLVYKGGIDSIPSADIEDIAKAENHVSAALAELAAGKPITQSSAKPYGCTVKYSG